MKKLSQEKDDQLLHYLDGELNAKEVEAFEKELLLSPDLNLRMEELRSVRALLIKKAQLEIPSKNFTQKVMSGLDAKPARSVFSYRQGLLLLIGSVIASGIALALLSAGVFDAPTTPLIVDSPLKNDWLNVPSISIPFNGKILVNGIIFFNLGLAFILLDRTILRPLFQRRNSMGY